MLKYLPCGPTEDGMYLVCYRVPGLENILSVAGSCRSLEVAEKECAQLNEVQVSDRRQALRDKANRISSDLPRK